MIFPLLHVSIVDSENQDTMLSKGQRVYRCSVCGLRYSSDVHLAFHFKRTDCHGYAGGCEKCGRVFKSRSGYDYHSKMTHGREDGRKRCTVCGKAMINLSALKLHMLSHSDSRQFACSYCGKTFKYPFHQKKHEGSCFMAPKFKT